MFRSTLALFALLIPFSVYGQVFFFSPENGAHGTSLPATCTTGDRFQLTSATNSAQLYLCTAANTWTQQTGTGGGGSSSFGTLTSGTNTIATMNVGIGAAITATGGVVSANQINLGGMPLSQPCIGTNGAGQPIPGTCSGGGTGTANVPTGTFSGATATFFAACSASSPCSVSKGGSQVDQIQATNTLTAPGSGSGTVYVYWTSSGPVVGSATGVAITIAGSGPLTGTNVQGITAFPASETAIISTLQFSSAAWTAVTNYQPTSANPPIIAVGTGLTSTTSGGTQTNSIDTSVVPTHSALTQNLVPHADSTGYNLVNGLLHDDGTTGVGINGAASSQSGIAERFSITDNGASFILTGIHSNAATTAEWEIFAPSGTAHSAFGGSTDPTTGFTYLNAGLGTGNVFFGTTVTGGKYYFTKPNGLNTASAVFVVNSAGGVQYIAQTLASLGTCNAGADGTIGRANDLTSAITWGTTAAAAGGGTGKAMLVCNSTNWVVMGQ